MQTFEKLSARFFLIFAFGLPLATVLCDSDGCLAQSNQKDVSTNGKILFVRKIDFDLGDEGANKVALNAMKTKYGDEFDRDSIAIDLKSIFAILRKYWESEGVKKPPDTWFYNLRAKPTKYGENDVAVTITISELMKTSNSGLDRFDLQSLPPIFRESFPMVEPDGSYSNRINSVAARRVQWRFKHRVWIGASSSCHLSGASAAQRRELQNFLDGKSDCFAGVDAE
ncbi:MAG: hypothetical protein P4L53_09445 [Candidatus Obscuribacterales bacterium]|nr:hypothetical protein [Candidatus Obscuribacterales bacterium]